MSNQEKARLERLAALGVKREIPTPEGDAKMSAVILQIAEPLIKQRGYAMSELKPSPKFHVGDLVSVKHGVADVDYPDIPMGGWVGRISKAENDTCLVRWSFPALLFPCIRSTK